MGTPNTFMVLLIIFYIQNYLNYTIIVILNMRFKMQNKYSKHVKMKRTFNLCIQLFSIIF